MRKPWSLTLALVLAACFCMSSLTFSKAQLSDREAVSSQTYSSNWAGYVVASDFSNPSAVVTMVNGSWIVPSVSTSASPRYSAIWVGIGGYFKTDSSLIQVGTEQDTSNNVAYYYAWYEVLPRSERRITNFVVKPGDLIVAWIYLYPEEPNLFNVTIIDATRQEQFSKNIAYSSSLLSAEWIAERPSVGGSLATLADFGTAELGYYYTLAPMTNYATVNTVTESMSLLRYESVAMTSSSGKPLASPSTLTADGTGYSVTYGTATTTNATTTTTYSHRFYTLLPF